MNYIKNWIIWFFNYISKRILNCLSSSCISCKFTQINCYFILSDSSNKLRIFIFTDSEEFISIIFRVKSWTCSTNFLNSLYKNFFSNTKWTSTKTKSWCCYSTNKFSICFLNNSLNTNSICIIGTVNNSVVLSGSPFGDWRTSTELIEFPDNICSIKFHYQLIVQTYQCLLSLLLVHSV